MGVGAAGAAYLDLLKEKKVIGEKDDPSRRWVFDVLGGSEIFRGAGQAFTMVGDYLQWTPDERREKLGETECDFVLPILQKTAATSDASFAVYAHPAEHVMDASLAGLTVECRDTIPDEAIEAAKQIKTDAAMHDWLARHCSVKLTVQMVVASPPERYACPKRLARLEGIFADPSPTVRKNAARMVEYLGLTRFFFASAALVRWRWGMNERDAFFPASELPLKRAGIAEHFLTDPPSAVKMISLELGTSGRWVVAGVDAGAVVLPAA
jgi:hypothetical protein